MGAAIGCFMGNLITPGVGGYIGSLIGGIVGGVSSSIGTDFIVDGSSYSVELYEKYEVDDQTKRQAYLKACATLDVPPSATRDIIKREVKI